MCLARIHGDRLTTKADGSRPEILGGVTPLLKRRHGRRGDIRIRTTLGAVRGGTTQVLALGATNLRNPAGETVALPRQGGIMVTGIGLGTREKRKRRRRKKKKIPGIRGGERAARIGRPLSRMVQVSARIGPSGGVPKASLLPQFHRAPPRSLMRPSSHQPSLSPPENTPTKTMQKL